MERVKRLQLADINHFLHGVFLKLYISVVFHDIVYLAVNLELLLHVLDALETEYLMLVAFFYARVLEREHIGFLVGFNLSVSLCMFKGFLFFFDNLEFLVDNDVIF